MYGFLLQDWITIRGSSSPVINSIAQSEQNWASLQPYQDIVFWLEVREVTLSLATLTLNYETAPLKDESLFTPMVTGVGVTAAATTPTITKVLLAQNPACPLGRFVRWRLALSGTAPNAAWDITFRIAACANAVSSLA